MRDKKKVICLLNIKRGSHKILEWTSKVNRNQKVVFLWAFVAKIVNYCKNMIGAKYAFYTALLTTDTLGLTITMLKSQCSQNCINTAAQLLNTVTGHPFSELAN